MKSLRPRAIILVNSDWYFWSHRLCVARALRDSGFDVVVIAPEERGFGDRIRDEGLRFIPINLSRRSLNPFRELSTIWTLARLYRAERPEIAHHVSVKAVIYGSIAARMSGIRSRINVIAGQGYVAGRSGVLGTVLRAVARRAFRAACTGDRTRVIFQNPDDRQTFIERRVVRPEHTVLIRGSGVDLDEYSYTPEPDGTPVVMFAGRLLWSKGLDDLVAAIKLVRARGRKVRLVIVGVPDDQNRETIPESYLRDLVAHGVAEWWGLRDDMGAVLAEASVVALPSRYGEGVPKILIEAAGAGRPIVAYDVPGCREVVQSDVNGFLPPLGDVSGLAAALDRLITDRQLRAQMGEASRDIAEREFGEDLVVQQTLDVYRLLLRDHPVAARLAREERKRAAAVLYRLPDVAAERVAEPLQAG